MSHIDCLKIKTLLRPAKRGITRILFFERKSKLELSSRIMIENEQRSKNRNVIDIKSLFSCLISDDKNMTSTTTPTRANSDKQIALFRDYLKEAHPNNVLMPGRIGKHPTGDPFKGPQYAHKKGDWTWGKSDAVQWSKVKMVGLLLKDLIVIDIDGKNFLDFYESYFPWLQTCPKEDTKKGAHYFFVRTPLCDSKRLFDGARALKSETLPAEDNNILPIDIKTVCSTGTCGFLVVSPSTDKSWVSDREPWTIGMQPIPKEFVEALTALKDDRRMIRDTTQVDAALTPPIREERFAPPWEQFEVVIRGLDISRHFGPNTYPMWTSLGWAMDNVGRAGGYRKRARELFDELSQRYPAPVYSEDSVIDLFENVRDDGKKLGFRYILTVLKEDNAAVYKEIDQQLKQNRPETVTDPAVIQIVHRFLASKFKCRTSLISTSSVITHDDAQYLIVDSRDEYCPITNTQHANVYYVIGRQNANEKCRHNDCKDKHGTSVESSRYPEDLSKALQLVFTGDEVERETLRKVILTYKKNDHLRQMTLQLGDKMTCPVRGTSYDLPENTYCPIHGCCHDRPENCIIHSVDFQRVAIGCQIDRSQIYPVDGLTVPKNIVNIFVQNVQNNYNSTTAVDDDLLSSDYAQDNLPYFANDPALQQIFISSLSGQQYDIAVLVHALWGEEFRFFDEKWHRFQNHIWEALEGVPKLRHILSSELCKKFQPVQVFYRDNAGLSRAKDKKASLDRMIANLKSAGFKDSVMKEVKEVFQIQNEGFAKEVNKADLLPFTNGVLDLSTYEFRDGRPEDKMTKSTHIEFRQYVEEDERCREMHRFFVNVMPNEAVRNFLLKVSALAMTRETKHQLFLILTGSGANGKSIYMDLMGAMLGDFAVTAPVDMLTGKREASHACNESLVALDGARMAAFNEPSVSGIIQADTMKVLAGGRDKISARGLHEKQRTFVPVFKMFLACNVIPRMSEDTLAVWRRVKVIHFPMKFCEDPNPDNQFEALIDEDLGDAKLPEWAPYLADYLLVHLKLLRRHGLKKPHEVERATLQYRQDSDQYSEFWTDCMVHHGDPNRAVNRSAVKPVFREWLRRHRFPDMSYSAMKGYWETRMTHVDTKRACIKVKGYAEWDVKEDFKQAETHFIADDE